MYLEKGMCKHNTLFIILFCIQNRSQLSISLPLCVICFKNVKNAKLRNVAHWPSTSHGWVQTASVNGLCMICLKSNWSKGDWFGRNELLAKNLIWLGLEDKSWFEPSTMAYIDAHTPHSWYIMEWNKKMSSKVCNLENSYVT